MRDFAEGVILQDYDKVESSESKKSLFKKTSGFLYPRFKDIEKFFGSLSPEGSWPKVLEVCAWSHA